MSSKINTRTIEHLEERRGKIFSKRGGWFPGKAVYNFGYSMLDDLVGKKSYFQIFILNATGKMVEKPVADWVESIHGCLSWPDPRIWCNQIGALAGTARASVVAGTTMGVLAADARTYGIYPLVEGVETIQKARQRQLEGLTAEQIVEEQIKAHGGKPHIMGYIRPLAKGDERIDTMEEISDKLGFKAGPHMELAYEIESILRERFDESMNINGYMSAFLSDQGFSSEEVYRIFASLVMSGVTACYIDTYEKPADTFMPLRCDDIDYQGKPAREVPDK